MRDGEQRSRAQEGAGPYKCEPIPGLICSPLNLVPKAGNKNKHRLIHNLAYPYDHNSVNANIPDSEAKVVYQMFDLAVKLWLHHGENVFTGKCDFDAAFRNLPIKFSNLILLSFTLDDLYYINSSMAFGAKSSCKIFEEFACSVQWIWEQETRSHDVSHYLDNFIMIHKFKHIYKWYMNKLQEICEFIGAPLSPDKTEGLVQIIKFLGLIINFVRQVIEIPDDKVSKALEQIDEILSCKHLQKKSMRCKTTVHKIQQLTGLLNFFCKAMPCGHPFLRRLYDLQAQALPTALRGKQVKSNPKSK